MVCKTNVELKGQVSWSVTPARDVKMPERLRPGSTDGVIYSDSSDPYKVRMQLLLIGDLALVGISGELYTKIGQYLKETSFIKDTIIVTHSSKDLAMSGYIYDDESTIMGGNGGFAYVRSRCKAGYVKDEMGKILLEMLKKT